jgi:hypothetical protein
MRSKADCTIPEVEAVSDEVDGASGAGSDGGSGCDDELEEDGMRRDRGETAKDRSRPEGAEPVCPVQRGLQLLRTG